LTGFVLRSAVNGEGKERLVDLKAKFKRREICLYNAYLERDGRGI